jgi:hypothetical protein
MLMGLAQFDTTSPLDTSGVSVSNPTGSQVDAALNAIAQSDCLNTPGSIWNPSNNSCQGSGGSSTCPTGFVLSGFACVAAPAGTSATSTAACPTGSTCSIVPGISNTNIFLAVAAVASMFFVAMAFGGKR